MLKSARSIAKAKWHNLIFKQSIVTVESCFPFFSSSHSKLVISLRHIKFGEVFHFANLAEDFADEGKGVMILDSDLIEAPIIDA